MNHYKMCLEKLNEFSQNSLIFVFLHKTDLLKENEKEAILDKKKEEISKNTIKELKIQFFFVTSIFDETLYSVFESH